MSVGRAGAGHGFGWDARNNLLEGSLRTATLRTAIMAEGVQVESNRSQGWSNLVKVSQWASLGLPRSCGQCDKTVESNL
jgi:hypothetical protein